VSFRRSRPCSTSRIVRAAVASFVTLSNGSEVSVVIPCFGLTTASPAAPVHTRPSGNTIAADAPGMPAPAKVSRSRASSWRAIRWVSRGPAFAAAPLLASSPLPPQPANTTAASTAPASVRRDTTTSSDPAAAERVSFQILPVVERLEPLAVRAGLGALHVPLDPRRAVIARRQVAPGTSDAS
jgi:hypothetical protein